MSKVGSSASSTADFERFVYADVLKESNGMELSVLSALSRRGLDPWQEAQRLAQLPGLVAADGLDPLRSTCRSIITLRREGDSRTPRGAASRPARRHGRTVPLEAERNTGANPTRAYSGDDGRDVWRHVGAALHAQAS